MDVFAVQACLVNVLCYDFTDVVLACACAAMQREGERLFGVCIVQEAGHCFHNHLLHEVLAEQPLLEILLQGCDENISQGTQKKETAGLKSELGKRKPFPKADLRTPGFTPSRQGVKGLGWLEQKQLSSLTQRCGLGRLNLHVGWADSRGGTAQKATKPTPPPRFTKAYGLGLIHTLPLATVG